MYDFTDENLHRYPNQIDKLLFLNTISVIIYVILSELCVTVNMVTQRSTEKARRNTESFQSATVLFSADFQLR